MASSKQKTTMNKINRERKLLEKRAEKQRRKLARANGSAVDELKSDPETFDGAEIQPDEQPLDPTSAPIALEQPAELER